MKRYRWVPVLDNRCRHDVSPPPHPVALAYLQTEGGLSRALATNITAHRVDVLASELFDSGERMQVTFSGPDGAEFSYLCEVRGPWVRGSHLPRPTFVGRRWYVLRVLSIVGMVGSRSGMH